jgi:hypothetical protein
MLGNAGQSSTERPLPAKWPFLDITGCDSGKLNLIDHVKYFAKLNPSSGTMSSSLNINKVSGWGEEKKSITFI